MYYSGVSPAPHNLTRLHQGSSYSLGRWFFRQERGFTPGTKEIEK